MEINCIAERQKAFFEKNRTKAYEFRKKALLRLKRTILYYEKEIEEALYKDLGKSDFEAYMTEVGMTLSELNYAEKHLKGWMKEKRALTPLAQFPAKSFEAVEPYGTVLIIAPWNYPFMLCMEPLIGAVAAGNCCVVKPSAYAPHTSAVIKKILSAVFPKEFVAAVEGGREENTALLEQKFDYIFFTGSKAVGKIVLEKAAQNLTPVTLELGGKSPCIVDETANLKLAAKRLVFGKYLNSGQTCVASDYLLIQEAVKEEFLEYLKYWIDKMFSAEPMKNQDYPKIINEKHYERIMKLMEGEHIIKGGFGNKERLFIAPTVLDDITEKSPIMQEEIFGPVLPVLTYRDLKEAEDFIKKGEKPLALYLFTGRKQTEKRVLREVSFGGGCINDTIIHLATSRMGFGGVGASGMGSYHGKKSFDTFSHTKSIVKKYQGVDLPIRYQPYTNGKKKLLRLFLK